MKIIRNYILRDLFSAFFFSLLLITLIMILGNLTKISYMIIKKGVPLSEAGKLFIFLTPYLLGFAIPLSLFLGVLLSLGRLIADNEIVAISMAGISWMQILKIFIIPGLIFSLLLFILNSKFLPDFHYRYRSEVKNLYASNIGAMIEPGVFLENFDKYILYVGDVEANKLKNVFIYEITENKLSRVTFAKEGEFVLDQKGILKVRLENGFRDEVNPKNPKEFYRLNFKVFFMDLPVKEKKKGKVEKKPSDMTMEELKKKINHFKKLNINPRQLIREVHKRISFSFSPLTFILLGLGVATVVRHREKSINLGMALLFAGFYYLLLISGEALVEMNLLLPWVGMWMPNIIFVLVGIYLIRKNVYFR